MPKVYYSLCLKKSQKIIFLGKGITCNGGQIKRKIGEKFYFLQISGFSKLYRLLSRERIYNGHYMLYIEKSGLPGTVNSETICIYFEVKLVVKIRKKQKKRRQDRYRNTPQIVCK